MKKKHFLVLCCVVLHAYQNKYGHRMWHNVGTSECLNMPLEKAETDGIDELFENCLVIAWRNPFMPRFVSCLSRKTLKPNQKKNKKNNTETKET